MKRLLAMMLGFTFLFGGTAEAYTRTVERTYTDSTPDRSGKKNGLYLRCKGNEEKPIIFNTHHRRELKVTLSEFKGDWALVVMERTGRVVAASDNRPNQTETVTIRIRKDGIYKIQPCNLGGSKTALVTISIR